MVEESGDRHCGSIPHKSKRYTHDLIPGVIFIFTVSDDKEPVTHPTCPPNFIWIRPQLFEISCTQTGRGEKKYPPSASVAEVNMGN